MKKFALLVIALLGLTVSAAFAQDGTMNLSWAVCRDAATTGLSVLNNEPDAGYTGAWSCNANSGPPPLTLNVGFRPTQSLNLFQATNVQIDIQLSTAGLVDWWSLAAGQCRDGNLVNNNVATDGQCVSPYAAVVQAGGSNITNGLGGANRIRYEADWTRTDAGGALPAPGTGGYFAQIIELKLGKTVAPFLSTVFCAGCNTAACIVLNKVIYAGGTQKFTITTPDLSAFVTWFGGTGGNCPGATPTRSSTWGQVKALYR